MKNTIFYYVLLFVVCVSCVQKFSMRDFTPRHLPKEVPEMVLTEYSDDRRGFEPDTLSYASMGCPISRILVSKNEVTNTYFCYFLNVDSIRTNAVLIKSIIDLSHAESKIELKNGKYYPLKGYENYPVTLVNWWGATYYCKWLTELVNKQREEKGLYCVAKYRLPSEFEWMLASNANGTYRYPVETICDSVSIQPEPIINRSHDIKSDTLNASGVIGINENVYEWTVDDFYNIKYVMDFSMSSYYYSDITEDAVVRKHGFMLDNNTCGRISRLRDGFYSDTGFRIVQTYLGRSTGVEF